jgi:TolB protein
MSDFDIQIVRTDGTGRRTLTGSEDWDVDAQWSPGGSRLSFTRSHPHPQSCSESSVWVIGRDRGHAHRVAAGCGARWSPDGTKLIYASPDDSDLRISNLATRRTRPLLQTRDQVTAAGWSQDGKTILFTRNPPGSGDNPHIFVINVDGTGMRKLSPGIAACWSPGGTKILYTTAFSSALYVMNRDGSGKRRIANVGGAEPDWR